MEVDAREGGRGSLELAEGHLRDAQGLSISSIGLGTRLGPADDETDARYHAAILEAASRGCNLFDTALGYREGRAEATLGRALEELRRTASLPPDPVVCTKGGTISGNGAVQRIDDIPADAVVGGKYSLWPELLRTQASISRDRLRADTIDVYYLTGLEPQILALGPYELENRLPPAFEMLERLREEGWIRYYGISSQNGLLQDPAGGNHLQLEHLVETARHVGGEGHGLRFVQSRYSIAQPTAMSGRNQLVAGSSYSLIQAVESMGLSFIAAETLASGHVLKEDAPWLSGVLSESATLAQQAIQFVRSTPGVASCLVGMSRVEHARENLALAGAPPASPDVFAQLVPPDAPQVPWLY